MAIQIDPQHPGTILRFFLVTEFIINLVEEAYFFCRPATFLAMILADAESITPAAESLLQCFAIVHFGINLTTGVGIPNTPTGIETRKSVYWMYLVVEVVAVPYFYYLAYVGPEVSGFDAGSARFLANNLMGPLLGRTVALYFSDCFGRYTYVDDKKAT